MTNCHGDEAKIIFFEKIIFFCLIPMTISHNPTNPRNDPWNFHKNILRIDRVEKWPFFESPFWIFFCKKKNIFCLIPMKISPKLCVRMDGTQLNIQYYDGLQPKMRAGIINEHECKFKFQVFLSLQDRKTNSFVHFLGEVNISTILFRDLLTFNCNPNWNL